MPSKKPKKQNRNARFKPWKRLIPFQVPPDAATSGVVAAFQNHLVTIFIKETDSQAFTDPQGKPLKMAHLMLQWTKDLKGTDEYFYMLKQKLKSELCGENSEFVELGPAAWREEDFKQTHLWVLPMGASFPVGIIPVDLEKAMADQVGGKENLVTKDELEVFVVKHEEQDMTEVFSNKEEAAKIKVSNVLAKSKAASSLPEIAETPELFYENDNEEFAATDEAEMDAEFEDEGPVGDEEHMAIAVAMKEAMANRAEHRADKAKAATASIVGQADTNIQDALKAVDEAKKSKIIIP